MPKFLEDKLKKEYGAKSKIPYMAMNKMGAMHGNKITKKGEAMEKKHEAKVKGLKSNGKKSSTIKKKKKSFAEALNG
jgi:hypothetical protein